MKEETRKSAEPVSVLSMEDEIYLSDGGGADSGADSSSVVCLEVSGSSTHVAAQTDFLIDIDGCADAEEENPAFIQPKAGEGLDLSNVLSNTPNSSQNGNESANRRRGKKTVCFNCGGEHVLAACTEKRDLRRISRNRDSFRSQFESMTRVHEHQPGDSAGFAPGRISKELREALGLNRREIPQWIFRMRRKGFIDGYPPAYLKRATEKNVLPFFNSNARSEEKVEGQFDDEVIDSEKMIRYPGFNHYDRSLDDPESFRVPPWGMFIECHQRVLDERSAAGAKRAAEVCATPTSRKRRHHPKSGENDEKPSKQRREEEGAARSEGPEEGEVVDDEQSASTTPESAKDGSGKTTPDQNGGSVEEHVDTSANGRESPGASTTTVILGTPILLRRDVHPDKYNHEVSVPGLEAFSIGINPYRHQEDDAKDRSGFLEKIGEFLKSLAGKGTEKKKGTKSHK